jgi:hypothetical protein
MFARMCDLLWMNNSLVLSLLLIDVHAFQHLCTYPTLLTLPSHTGHGPAAAAAGLCCASALVFLQHLRVRCLLPCRSVSPPIPCRASHGQAAAAAGECCAYSDAFEPLL